MRRELLSLILISFTVFLASGTADGALARDDLEWGTKARGAALPPIAVSANIVEPRPAPRRASSDLGAFDSVAISSRSLPAASKWRGASAPASSVSDLCSGENCSTFVRALRRATERAAVQSPVAKLRTINSVVNRTLAYGSDRSVWGVGDYWATPAEIVARGRGDCEDYAILKYWLLRDAGFSADQLQLVVLRDTRKSVYHAVLAVHLDGQRYILDNLAASVRSDESFASYMPIMSFVGDKSYIHGFRNKRAETAAMPTSYADIAPGEGI